jgi:phosphotransferase system IIB component
MNAEINKFLKISGLIALPYAMLMILYFILDPFLVLRNYENYYAQKSPLRNIDYVSTETYGMNREKEKYDSFIFGSSKSQAFKAVEWKKYLNNAKTFHFSANAESVFGIYGKVKFIHSMHDTIRNALLVVDHETFELTGNDKGVLFIKHPLISNESRFTFHAEFIKAWFQNLFFFKYIYFLITGANLPFISHVLDLRPVIYNPGTNDLYYKQYDDAIASDSVKYYSHPVFMERIRKSVFSKETITAKGITELEFIAGIFRRDHTNYKIVISPSFDQQLFNRADLKKLQLIFKKENIYDFSGVNDLTIFAYNYYEEEHYRPFVADRILKKIYTQQP